MYHTCPQFARLKSRTRISALAAIALGFGLLLSGCAGLPRSATVPSAGCRSDPLAGVYYPWRLHLIAPCVTVSGTVTLVKVEPDHDWHVNLRLDPGEPRFTNWVNRQRKGGDLVLEVIPMDQPNIPVPSVGEHITVTGAYVLDILHGWREIHPVWKLNGQGSPQFTAAAARESVDAALHRR